MSQIYLGDKLIASTEGSDIKYDENTSINEKIDELKDGYLPITGGTLTDRLYLLDSDYLLSFIASKINGLSIGVCDGTDYDDNNHRRIKINNTSGTTEIKKAIQFASVVDGNASFYNMYGSHNVTCGTTALTAGTSELITDAIHLVYS